MNVPNFEFEYVMIQLNWIGFEIGWFKGMYLNMKYNVWWLDEWLEIVIGFVMIQIEWFELNWNERINESLGFELI